MVEINGHKVHTYKYAHRQVADTAKELAGAAYDRFALNNEWYKKFPSRRLWVKRAWPLFRDEARKVLAALLTQESIAEYLKESITEALIEDHQLKIEGLTWQAQEGI